MDAIVYRALQTSDADAVFAVVREAWQFTYATIFDPTFVDQFVRTNYAPERLRALVPLVEAHQMFFDVALDADQCIGFCNIGMTERGAELFRIYLRPAYIGRGIGSTLLERGEGFVRTRGSRPTTQAFVSGNAAKLAGEDLREKPMSLLGTGPGAVLRLEGATLVGDEAGAQRRLDLAALPADRQGDVAIGEGYFNPPTVPLDQDGQGEPYATYAFVAQMAEVEVDLELGTVEVLHIDAAHDVGKAINPTQVEGQIHGGIAQGLGMALMEEYVSGRTDNLHDYLIPTCGDIPMITTYPVEDPDPLGPYGAKSVDEPAVIATAPAILHAIYQATGARLRCLPATPDRLRKAVVSAATGT